MGLVPIMGLGWFLCWDGAGSYGGMEEHNFETILAYDCQKLLVHS